jgi:hypothetical protein
VGHLTSASEEGLGGTTEAVIFDNLSRQLP